MEADQQTVTYVGAGWLLGDHPPGRRGLGEFGGEALEATLLAQHEAWATAPLGRSARRDDLRPLTAPSPVHRREPGEREAAEAVCGTFDDVIWRTWIRALHDGILAVPSEPIQKSPR